MPKVDAVFEGGGVRGIGLVGAASHIEDQGYEFENVAGTSAGAIVASLIAAGYSGAQLTQIMRDLDYRRFRDKGLLDQIPLLGPGLSILFEKGWYEGNYLVELLSDLLGKKGVRTFADLVIPQYADDPKYRYRLQVVASDITRGKMLVLPGDIVDYGIQPDDLKVADAVRMSMSIPYFFEPVDLTDTSGRKCFIVDGGLLSNFPVLIFDDGTATPPWPTFGFRLVDPSWHGNRIWGPVTFTAALVKTMLSAHDDRYVRDADFVRTIAVPTCDVGVTEFNISDTKRDDLYDAGRDAAKRFLKHWDFGKYKARFRAATPPSRGIRLRV